MTKFTMNRRNFLATGQAMVLGTALIPMLAGRGAAQGLTEVTYLTPFGYLISFAGTMYADTGGFFEKEGLDVSVEGGRGSSMAVQQVTAGNALVSRTGGTDLIKAYANDPSIVAIAECYERDLFFVISSEDDPITSPADMAGKTIGIVSPSGATENLLDMMLVAEGVNPEDVRREVVGNAPSAFEMVRMERISAYIATSDTLFQLRAMEKPVNAFSTDEFARSPGQVYMTSKTTLEERPEELTAFIKAVHGAMSEIANADDLQPIIESMLSEYEIVEASREDKGVTVLNQGVPNFKRVTEDNFASSQDSWDSAYELMVKAGLIPELENRDFFDDRILKRAFS